MGQNTEYHLCYNQNLDLCLFVKREHAYLTTQLILGVSFDTKQNEQQLMLIIIESNPALENIV